MVPRVNKTLQIKEFRRIDVNYLFSSKIKKTNQENEHINKCPYNQLHLAAQKYFLHEADVYVVVQIGN